VVEEIAYVMVAGKQREREKELGTRNSLQRHIPATYFL
jgi:hypothetical protein